MDLLLEELKSLSTDFVLLRDKERLSDLKIGDQSLSNSELLQHSLANPFSAFSNPQLKRLLNPSERSFYSDPMVASRVLALQQEPMSDFNVSRSSVGLAGSPETQLLQSELYRMRSSLSEKTAALDDSTARMGKLENKIEVRSTFSLFQVIIMNQQGK